MNYTVVWYFVVNEISGFEIRNEGRIIKEHNNTLVDYTYFEWRWQHLIQERLLYNAKGESEAVTLRRTDNTMDKRKITKGLTNLRK